METVPHSCRLRILTVPAEIGFLLPDDRYIRENTTYLFVQE